MAGRQKSSFVIPVRCRYVSEIDDQEIALAWVQF